jgi:hypothetical protein
MPIPVTTTLRFNEAPPARKIRKAKKPSSSDRGAAFWLSERAEPTTKKTSRRYFAFALM